MSVSNYTLGSAGFYLFRKLDILNNNLANLNTVGFKQDKVSLAEQRFEEALAAKLDNLGPYARYDFERYRGSKISSEFTIFDQGPIMHTGNSLDVAITNPDAFFVVETKSGLALTRAGNFAINDAGQLVTQSGQIVLGDGGPISIGNATDPKILPNGKVVARVGDNEIEVGRISVVRANGTLEKIGSNLFRLQGSLEPVESPQLAVGHLEQSNVELVPTMLELIATNRTFEFYTRVVRAIEELNDGLLGSGN